MRVVDYDEALAMLREIAAGREDYVYERPNPLAGCVNWVETVGESDDHPTREASCIIGHLYERLGVLDDVDRTASVANVLYGLEHYDKLKFTNKAVKLAEVVQYEQDRGTPWGQAIDNAIPSGSI